MAIARKTSPALPQPAATANDTMTTPSADTTMDDGELRRFNTAEGVSEVARDHRNRHVILAGQHAMIRLPLAGLKMVKLKEKGVILLGKYGLFQLANILGYPWGLSFEVLDNHEVKQISSLSEEIELTRDDLTQIFAENNQNIINVGAEIQGLLLPEITELKKLGPLSKIGQQIIEKMIASHDGFDKKTVYLQQKYLKRKQQKYLRRFTVEFVGVNELLEYHQDKDMVKMLDMSMESLGLMMLYANVQPGGRYLVLDDTTGVVTYALMERMAGEGEILLVHENEYPNLLALQYADYSEAYKRLVIRTIDWLQVVEPEELRIQWVDYSETEIAELKGLKRTQYFRRKQRAHDVNYAIDMMKNGGFDALICATTLYLPTLLPYVLDQVGGSNPIVIYNQHKELLMQVQNMFTLDKRVLAPSLFELRVVPFQTVPGKMHPLMTMRGYGGYVLWGTKVIPNSDDIVAVGRGILKRKRDSLESKESTPANA